MRRQCRRAARAASAPPSATPSGARSHANCACLQDPATAASHVPLYGIPASFVKTKVRYLTAQYDDPDSKAAGVTSFRLENKEILDSVLNALATSAGLIRRGEIYVRKKE